MNDRRKIIERAVPLTDLDVGGAEGRTVTAYAATFNDRYEVTDQWDGTYLEAIRATAFNKALERTHRVVALFNHGRDLAGRPAERYAMPIGTPVEIRADGKGLLTRTRYAKTPLGDEVLELVRDGAITGYSFRGPIIRSTDPVRTGFGLPVIERLELGLIDYGPGTVVANQEAAVVGIRSQALLERIDSLTDEQREQLEALIGPLSPDTSTGAADGTHESTPPGSSSTDTQDLTPPPGAPPAGPSLELLELEAANRRRRA